MPPCYLYTYENTKLKEIYIGIATSRKRPFGVHNPDATRLLNDHDTEILITSEPFSTRTDALKAESIAIHVASKLGVTVNQLEEDDESDISIVTNRAGIKSSKWLMPAVYETTPINLNELSKSLIVPVSIEKYRGAYQDEDVAVVHGAISPVTLADRAAKYWKVAKDKREQVDYLVAVLTGVPGRRPILGVWEIDKDAEWESQEGEPNRVAVPLVDPSNYEAVPDLRGRMLVDYPNSGVRYSPDIV